MRKPNSWQDHAATAAVCAVALAFLGVTAALIVVALWRYPALTFATAGAVALIAWIFERK